jgi:ATP-dependent Clp protease ATP-binding subunit ClpA
VFECYTESARLVVVRAQEVARQLLHNYIGTEHLLLGLLGKPDELPAQVFASFGVSEERARARVIEIVGAGEEPTRGQIPFTHGAKRTLELSLRESLALGHKSIRPGHMLLGLLRENDGVAGQILLDFNLTANELREQVIRRLAAEPDVEVTPARRHEPRPDRVDPPSNLSFAVTPDNQLRRLLMAAGGRALSEAREEFGLGDLLAIVRELPEARGMLDGSA